MTKWMTREHPRCDRVACPWLIHKFIDKDAEIIYLPRDQNLVETAEANGATPFDGPRGLEMELGHHDYKCSFDAFVDKYELIKKHPPMALMAHIIRGADTGVTQWAPEAMGVEAILDGIRELNYPDDHAQRKASYPLLDALYAYCESRYRGTFEPAS